MRTLFTKIKKRHGLQGTTNLYIRSVRCNPRLPTLPAALDPQQL